MTMVAEQTVREAIATILNANAALRILCARTSKIGIERGAYSVEATVPVAVVYVDLDNGTGAMTCEVDGVARGVDAGERARAIRDAVVAALDYPAFAGQGLEIVAMGAALETIGTDDERTLNREGDPMLHQARATIPLLYLE